MPEDNNALTEKQTMILGWIVIRTIGGLCALALILAGSVVLEWM